jgi:OmpA-OmpF porin, OOP family
VNYSRHLVSVIAIACASLATVSVAQAQTNTSRSGSGFSMYSPGSSYIGFNAGKSDFSLGNGTGLFSGDDKDTAYNIYAGSFFNPYMGLELGYTDFGKAKRGGGDTKAMGFNLSLVGKYPLGSSFNLLGKVGTTYGRTEVSSLPGSGVTSGKENGFGVSYGVGAEYLFTPQLSAVAQYDEHRLKFAGTGRDRIGVASLGLRYRF